MDTNTLHSVFEADILPLRDTLVRVAMSVVHDADDAEDVVQDTMLRMWARRDEWSAIRDMASYCTTMCHRLAQDRMKMAGRRLTEPLDAEGHERVSDTPSPQQMLAAAELQHTIEVAIACLPVVQRQILALRENDEMTYDEIADTLGISMSQVKVYLMRARQRLRKAIAQK